LDRALQGSKSYHALLVGPRGSGKTHLVTMAVHELEQREHLRDRMRIAWLGEDDTFTGLIDIALGMGDQLARRYPDTFPADFRQEVRGLTADDAAEAILTRILERASKAQVLLVMENLNRAFNGLGDSGQKQWRAFLQNRGRITLLGTSQQLFEGIESRDRPFFGFFDITHLQPLSVEDARALIYKIAIEEGRDDLAQFLATPEGRFRVRALHHLAGGNHRLYVQLSEFLTKDSLEDLVTAFEQIEEELTPYFQERLRSLAPQQARIVECLCGAPGAMSVKQIHEDTFIPERSCSKQLSLLKQMNYVRGTSSGKETFYELREPLLRLCLEVKHQRGAPLELVVQFIRAWFRPAGEFAAASKLRGELAVVTSKASGFVPNGADEERGRPSESPRLTSARAQISEGIKHAKVGRLDAAITDFTAVIEQPDAPPDQIARAHGYRGVSYCRSGKYAESQADFRAVLDDPRFSENDKNSARFAVVEPMIITSVASAVASALADAFQQTPRESPSYGGAPEDVVATLLRRGHQDWASYLQALVPVYLANNYTSELGTAAVRSAGVFDGGEYSLAQMDTWLAAWRSAAAENTQLGTSVEWLAAALEAIKSKSERPLLSIPLEIRTLIRPLLSKSLGPVESNN